MGRGVRRDLFRALSPPRLPARKPPGFPPGDRREPAWKRLRLIEELEVPPHDDEDRLEHVGRVVGIEPAARGDRVYEVGIAPDKRLPRRVVAGEAALDEDGVGGFVLARADRHRSETTDRGRFAPRIIVPAAPRPYDSLVRSGRLLPALNLAAKVVLVGLLVYGMTHLHLERFAGKAMPARAVLYPVSILIVPIGWLLRGRRPPYPHFADLFMALPFIVDVAGNALDLYNTIVWFDDVAHAVTFGLLVLAVGDLFLRLDLEPWITAGLSIGFGAVAHILWEIIEFVTMWYGAPALQLTYEDTIGDLALSLCGTVIAGLITGWRARAQRSGPTRPVHA